MEGTPDAQPDAQVTSLSAVKPRYVTSGAKWNDYVKADGVDALHATGTACNAITDATRRGGCLHAGAMRSVDVNGLTDCTGVQATDALGAFDWTCIVEGGQVTVVSTGLKNGIHLSDLIAPAGNAWRDNAVTVQTPSNSDQTTTPAVWWTNPVVVAGGGTTSLAGTDNSIFVFIADATADLSIDADGVGLVVMPGATVSASSSGVATQAVVSVSNFVWIEGTFRRSDADAGLELASNFSVLDHVTVTDGASPRPEVTAIDLDGAANLVQDVTAHRSAGTGIRLRGSFHTVRGLRVASASSDGLRLQGITGSVLVDVSVADCGFASNGGDGVFATGSSHNTLAHAVLAGNELHGLWVEGDSDDNTFVDITSVNNGNDALRIYDGGTLSSNNRFLATSSINGYGWGLSLDGAAAFVAINNLYAYNPGQDGLRIQSGSDGGLVADMASTGNAPGISNNDTEVRFTGAIIVGDNTGDCQASNFAGFGIMSEAGTNACVVDTTISDATVVAGASLAGSFVAGLTTDDLANPSDVAGIAPWAAGMDVLSFDNDRRAWGFDETPFSDNNDAGPCHGRDCRIYDWSLLAADTVVRGVNPMPDGTLVQTWSADMLECAAIPGATWNGTACTSTFLKHAYELIDDGEGNDNGLCEADETCLYTPNIGSYQGHGALVTAQPTSTGTLTGITLLKYATNGR